MSWPFTCAGFDKGMAGNNSIAERNLQGHSFRVAWVVGQMTRSTSITIDSDDELIQAWFDIQVFMRMLLIFVYVRQW